jgi:uncharacterized protein (TIGR00251 family)
MAVDEALSCHPLGLTIRFEITAGASQLAVPSGFNPWRRSLEARLTEEASRGRANRQLIKEVARIFSLPEEEVEILRGERSSRKVLLVKGRGMEEAVALLKLNKEL